MLFYEYFINNTSRSFFGLVVILSGQTAQNTDSPVKDTKVPVSDASEAQPLFKAKNSPDRITGSLYCLRIQAGGGNRNRARPEANLIYQTS